MTAGYSGTPLVGKLGVKPGHRVVLVGAPGGWHPGDLPAAARLVRRGPVDQADIVVAFFAELAALQRRVPELAAALPPAAALWVAWPRRAGGHRSDITDNDVRATVLPLGLVDVKVAALDSDWSGLKVVWRRGRR